MLDLIVFLKSSGVNVNLENINDAITSFHNKNEDLNYKFYIVVEASLESHVKKIFQNLNAEEKILHIKKSDEAWAIDFNQFFSEYQDKSEWLLICHDDVSFVTKDYFKSIIAPLKDTYENLGWVTSTNEHYYVNLGKRVTDTFRPGFYKDNHNWPNMFQLHENGNIDYPENPVKIHGPMSALMIIRMTALKKIGLCENWTNYTMLVDEDWSLSALKHNLVNVWVPNVHHLHPLRINKRSAMNRWETEAHEGFKRKWGFDVGNAKTKNWEQGVSVGVNKIREDWGNTLIPWSSYKNSYDWEYVYE